MREPVIWSGLLTLLAAATVTVRLCSCRQVPARSFDPRPHSPWAAVWAHASSQGKRHPMDGRRRQAATTAAAQGRQGCCLWRSRWGRRRCPITSGSSSCGAWATAEGLERRSAAAKAQPPSAALWATCELAEHYIPMHLRCQGADNAACAAAATDALPEPCFIPGHADSRPACTVVSTQVACQHAPRASAHAGCLTMCMCVGKPLGCHRHLSPNAPSSSITCRLL